MPQKTTKPTRRTLLVLPKGRYPMPLRCQCGALLMKLTGPANLEIKCRRCARLVQLQAS